MAAAKIKVSDIAKKMGMSDKDMIFRLQSLGAEVNDPTQVLEPEVIQALITGKKLVTRTRSVIMREDKPVMEKKKEAVRPPRPIVQPPVRKKAEAPKEEPAAAAPPAVIIPEFVEAVEAEERAAKEAPVVVEKPKAPKVAKPKVEAGATVARPSTAFLVTHMMRSVLNEGTGASARSSGFTTDAAGKSGTTNDLRDAWFVGFTPELLTVVWVGLDDNQPLGLSGSQAALPIWTAFMKNTLQGRGGTAFEAPDGVSFVEIDRDTGKIATPICPRLTNEAFLSGTEPLAQCELHRVQ